MESSGQPNRIQISLAAADALVNCDHTWLHRLEYRGSIQVKGKVRTDSDWGIRIRRSCIHYISTTPLLFSFAHNVYETNRAFSTRSGSIRPSTASTLRSVRHKCSNPRYSTAFLTVMTPTPARWKRVRNPTRRITMCTKHRPCAIWRSRSYDRRVNCNPDMIISRSKTVKLSETVNQTHAEYSDSPTARDRGRAAAGNLGREF